MTTTEQRIAHVESELALHRLVAEYCHGVDTRDRDRFSRVWAPDAVWVVRADLEFRGVDAICGAAERQWAVFVEMHHLTTNHVVNVTGDDADGQSDVQAAILFDDGAWRQVGGTYHDTYARHGGEWRITRRVVSSEYAIVSGGTS